MADGNFIKRYSVRLLAATRKLLKLALYCVAHGISKSLRAAQSAAADSRLEGDESKIPALSRPLKGSRAMTKHIAARKFGDKGAAHIKDASEQFGVAAEQTTKVMEQTYATAANGIRDYNLKALEIARVNSDSAFDYARQLMSVKSPSEMLELWTTHARKQFEVLTEQTKGLAVLGQKVVTETTGPVTKALNKVA
jgi:phasin